MDNPLLRLLSERFAGRSIDPRQLSEEILVELVEAARLTPSCFNKQPWHFLFLQSAESRAKGVEALAPGNQVWAVRAPLLIFGYSRPEDDCQMPDGREYHQFDLGMSVMSLLLSATHHGLAARPMAGFDPEKVRTLFGLDPLDRPMVAIAVGYPAADESHLPEHYRGKASAPRERKAAGEILKRL